MMATRSPGSSPSRDCRYAANDFVSSTVRA